MRGSRASPVNLPRGRDAPSSTARRAVGCPGMGRDYGRRCGTARRGSCRPLIHGATRRHCAPRGNLADLDRRFSGGAARAPQNVPGKRQRRLPRRSGDPFELAVPDLLGSGGGDPRGHAGAARALLHRRRSRRRHRKQRLRRHPPVHRRVRIRRLQANVHGGPGGQRHGAVSSAGLPELSRRSAGVSDLHHRWPAPSGSHPARRRGRASDRNRGERADLLRRHADERQRLYFGSAAFRCLAPTTSSAPTTRRFQAGGSQVLYASIPTLPLVHLGKGCQFDRNRRSSSRTGTSRTWPCGYMSHEDSETLTDPFGTGWWDSDHRERDRRHLRRHRGRHPAGRDEPERVPADARGRRERRHAVRPADQRPPLLHPERVEQRRRELRDAPITGHDRRRRLSARRRRPRGRRSSSTRRRAQALRDTAA